MPRTRVVHAPTPFTAHETQDVVRPMTDEDLEMEYPTRDFLSNPWTRSQAKHQSNQLEEGDQPNDGPPTDNAMQPTETATESQPDDARMFTVDRIIAHRVNHHRRHRYAKYNKVQRSTLPRKVVRPRSGQWHLGTKSPHATNQGLFVCA